MFKHYLLMGAGIVAGLIAYVDSTGLAYLVPLPPGWEYLPIGLAVANVVLQQLRRASVDRPTVEDDFDADDPY
jgi:hypothetical protein